MNSGYFAIICLILCALTQQTAAAGPSTCEGRLHYLEWTQKYFDTADAVFLGKVVTEETPDPPAPKPAKPAGSMKELLEQIETGQARDTPPRFQTATFRIHKSWKGPVGPMIAVKANLYFDDTGHHALLSTGDSYLVFAYKSDDEVIFRIPVGCTSHESVKETGSKIRVLDALTKKPGDR